MPFFATMLFMIKQIIAQHLKKIFKKEFGKDYFDKPFVFDPPKEINADYYTNAAFILAKILKKNINETAKQITAILNNNKKIKEIIGEIFEQNGFINFKLKDDFIAQNLFTISKNGFFDSIKKIRSANSKRKIIIEYSSPNIAKKMHAGHLRSTIIGDAIKNIFLWLGYKVISWNHIGDWGTQFGKLLYMYKKKYGSEIVQISVGDLEKLYVEFNKMAQLDKTLQEKARAQTKQLQSGNKTNVKLWRYFKKISLNEFNKFYKLLDIKFDYIIGESFYQKFLPKIVKKALKQKIAIKSQGAVIIPLEKFNLPPLLIQKSDGAFLYATTDLASLDYRIMKFKPEKIVYVVANEQTLHFEQFFVAAKILGILNEKECQCLHIKFGLLLDESGKKFSTRGGNIVYLENLINDVLKLAFDIVNQKNPSLSNKAKKEIAEIIGIGAIKYNDLSRDRQGDIIFNRKKMLSLEGNSAPYLQYTFVRINSIFKKAGQYRFGQISFTNDFEHNLAVLVLKFPEIISEAANLFKPNILADYLYNLASTFHHYYETSPILSAPPQIKNSRLVLIKAIAQVIKEGLKILGIKTPKKM